MHVRNATGRQVSLLNDDSGGGPSPSGYYGQDAYAPKRPSYRAANQVVSQPFAAPYHRRASSSPNTPELLRADSYDSQISSTEPLSPSTPGQVIYDYGNGRIYAPVSAAAAVLPSPYDDYMDAAAAAAAGYMKRPIPGVEPRAPSYDEDEIMADSTSQSVPAPGGGVAASGGAERVGKRYPCRYRESHGCEKTFTTSGHASRHSKIHTAEKAVQCTFAGCAKKFTRADNMKQHLETHYKDKSASSASASSSSSSSRSSHHSSPSSSSRPSLSSDRRTSSSLSKASSGSSRSKAMARAVSGAPATGNSSPPPPPPLQASPEQQPMAIAAMQTGGGGTWDMRGIDLSLLRRPGAAVRTPSSGLDALVMAVACQEGA